MKIYKEFIAWLEECSRHDSEDIHQFRNMTTYECSKLLGVLLSTSEQD